VATTREGRGGEAAVRLAVAARAPGRKNMTATCERRKTIERKKKKTWRKWARPKKGRCATLRSVRPGCPIGGPVKVKEHHDLG
jgi:hypothetical protein